MFCISSTFMFCQ